MTEPLRRLPRPQEGWDPEYLLDREWLVTNALGGYASSTLACVDTRSYHGLLTAALPGPLGRVLLLKQITERLEPAGGAAARLTESGPVPEEGARTIAAHLAEFRVDAGLPVWRFQVGERSIEKHVVMPHQQNTVYAGYRYAHGKGRVRLGLRPWVHFHAHDNPSHPKEPRGYLLRVQDNHYEIAADREYPMLRLMLHGEGARFVIEGGAQREIYLRTEAERGYRPHGELWSPGYFLIDLLPGQHAALVASAEPWNAVTALRPEEVDTYERARRRRLIEIADPRLREPPLPELVLAADQFMITPTGRVRDAIRAHAYGDQVRSTIAGYHWFADWGRDAMISLKGLTLATGRYAEAAWVLRTFRHYVRDGLLPNTFPEGQEEGVYNTADATLWFFHALDRYVAVSGDRDTLEELLPVLHQIVRRHLEGTRFGIGVDPQDGLLRQGAEGYPLTWMDAKVDDWVVTPRRGKPVEINALWYNALRLLARWTQESEGAEAARPFSEAAAGVRHAFNARFWYADGGYLYDVVDGEQGDDITCRPNQVFAISLPHPVLDREHWNAVLDVVQRRLLTPMGLRSLAPDHPNYKARYFGDLRARDAAYHEGTVWPWLIGAFVDAWLAAHPGDRKGARRWLEGLLPQLDQACVGSISEIFDAEAPYAPRGCIAQAWSVAEVLRGWVKTAGDGERA